MTGLAIIGGSYQLLKKLQKKRQKGRILKILQETRRELFPSLKRLADMHPHGEVSRPTDRDDLEEDDFLAKGDSKT